MKNIRQYLEEFWVILAFSMVLGFLNNIFSPNGISLVYSANNNPFFENHPNLNSIDFPQIIDLKKAKSFFDSKTGIFVDARPFNDYKKAHITGAISLPLTEFKKRFMDVKQKLPKNYNIIVYCDNVHCDLSSRLAYRLIQEGYLYSYIFENGLKHWQVMNYPVEKN